MPRCALGEAATWSAQRQALLWTDISGRRLWSFEPASGRIQHWTLPGRLGSFALTRERHRLLAAFEHELAWLDLRSGECQKLASFQVGAAVRANDGRCDRHGNFLFGTFDEQRDAAPQGRWWRCGTSGQLQALDLPPVFIANGLAFSPDGQRIYFCDSHERMLRCAGYDAAHGHIGEPHAFAQVKDGEPDGATVDAQGHYWCAIWGAGQVLGWHADGTLMARVELPVSQPSCVAFGGRELQTLYITTARVGLSVEQLARESDAGALFAVDLPWPGLKEPLFGPPG
jgi:L-arabinonolactonase